MLRFNTRLISVVAMFTLAGCHTPAPSFNPLIGYGSPRVSPPATGSYGSPDSYYPSGAAASASNTPAMLPGSNVNLSVPASNNWQAVRGSATPDIRTGASASPVGPYRYNATPTGLVGAPNWALGAPTPTPDAPVRNPTPVAPTATIVNATPPIRIVPMPTNDATMQLAPGQFTPQQNAVEISQLPTPIRTALPGSNRVRGLATRTYPVVPSQVMIPLPATSNVNSVPAPAAATSATTPAAQLGWRPKYTPSISGGVIRR